MSVHLTWKESHGQQETTVECLVIGPVNRAEIIAELAAELPATYGTFVLKSLGKAELIPGHLDHWICEVTYGAYGEKRRLQAGESEFKFSSVRRSYTRTTSISSRVFGPSGEIAYANLPVDANIIGWKESEKRATGVSLTEYVNAFSWRVAVPFGTATESWRREIGRLRGSVCDTGFFGYEAESVKFEDITGGVKGTHSDGASSGPLYIFELSFEQIDNIDELTIGGITVTDLKGWEVLDINDQKFTIDTDRWFLVPEVQEVKVHQVLPKKNWSAIFSLLSLV